MTPSKSQVGELVERLERWPRNPAEASLWESAQSLMLLAATALRAQEAELEELRARFVKPYALIEAAIPRPWRDVIIRLQARAERAEAALAGRGSSQESRSGCGDPARTTREDGGK